MGLASIGWKKTLPTLFLLATRALATVVLASEPGKNEKFTVSEVCGENKKTPNTRIVEGAVLSSLGERNMNCVVTFQTDTILQRFMLRFERLQLDCNDHLIIYDGAYTTSPHKSDLSCRNTLQNVGTIFTHSNHVTLQYQTDQWGPETNGFNLLITAFKEKSHTCLNFRCQKTSFCIDNKLTCDGVNHCGDGSDESTSLAKCPSAPLEDIFGVSRALLLSGIASIVVCVCLCTTSIAICLCRRGKGPAGRVPLHDDLGNMQDQSYQMDYEPNYNTNGTFGSLEKSPAYIGSATGTTKISNTGRAPSENPHRPAYGLGRRTAQNAALQCEGRRSA